MKFLYTWGSIACMLVTINAASQLNPPLHQQQAVKQKLFSHLPEKFFCAESSLQHIFSVPLNGNISVMAGYAMKIEGTVLAKVAISPTQLSMNIRCNNYEDALLNLSRITAEDGSVHFIGRMVSPRHGDVLLLWQENGQYAFIRQDQLLTMVE